MYRHYISAARYVQPVDYKFTKDNGGSGACGAYDLLSKEFKRYEIKGSHLLVGLFVPHGSLPLFSFEEYVCIDIRILSKYIIF